MRRTQVSTKIGWLSMLGGFLAIYNDVKLTEFMTVFNSLTFGEVIAMLTPFIAGIWAIMHDEKSGAAKL